MTLLRRVWRLFVDDGRLAGLAVGWVAVVWMLGLPGPVLFVGLSGALVWSAAQGRK